MSKKLKLYFTSDIHGYFFSTTYADRDTKNRGLFKCRSQFVKDEETLIIDGGDILQGSAYTYYCQSVLHSNASIAEIMNECGYDFVTLGNHDFNYGTGYLGQYLEKLDATCICENILDRDGNRMYPYQIKTLSNGLRVGIVGIVTDYVNIWEKPENIKEIQIVSPVERAKSALEELKGNVDLTICVYHGGFERDLATGKVLSETTENLAYKICEELEFDLLLTGHQHMSIPGQYVNGTFVVQPKENGTEYQYIEVTVDQEKKEIVSQICKPEDSSVCEPKKSLAQIECDVQDWLDNVVGELERPLLPEAKIDMATNGNVIVDFLNEIQLHYSGADISAVSLANEIAGFNKQVTSRDIIATYPYPNTLVVFEMTGKSLRAAIERSAEYIELVDGKYEVSKDFLEPKVEHYNYDFYAGVDYTIDPAQPIGSRVVRLLRNGIEVKDEEVFSVCVNNYRASGAGNYPMYPECKVLREVNTEMVELIMNYFEEHRGQVIKVATSNKIVKC